MECRLGWTTGAVVVLFALAMSGCGSGGGGGDDDVGFHQDITPGCSCTPGSTPPTGLPLAPTPTPGGETTVPGTATPVATPTPSGGVSGNATVRFDITSSTALFGFQFTVTYPVDKGGFAGSASTVQCSVVAVNDVFTKNDEDDGRLILSVANIRTLTFPMTINCKFTVAGGATLASPDVGVTEKEVTDETGEIGDPDALTVAIGVV